MHCLIIGKDRRVIGCRDGKDPKKRTLCQKCQETQYCVAGIVIDNVPKQYKSRVFEEA